MSYNQALDKAWKEIAELTKQKKFSIKLLADDYEIDLNQKNIISLSCNVPAKEYTSIILLHYLIQKLKLKILPIPSGEWIDFRQIQGGDAYYPAFKKRIIDTLLRKYGSQPDKLLELTERITAKRVQFGDIGIMFEALDGVPVLITAWRQDEEFGPQANILFDKSIIKIFCTEDIVVLADIIVHLL